MLDQRIQRRFHAKQAVPAQLAVLPQENIGRGQRNIDCIFVQYRISVRLGEADAAVVVVIEWFYRLTRARLSSKCSEEVCRIILVIVFRRVSRAAGGVALGDGGEKTASPGIRQSRPRAAAAEDHIGKPPA